MASNAGKALPGCQQRYAHLDRNWFRSGKSKRHDGLTRNLCNNDCRYEGAYHKGIRQGSGVYRYGKNNEGGVYMGEWLQGKMNGCGFMLYPDGEHYIGLCSFALVCALLYWSVLFSSHWSVLFSSHWSVLFCDHFLTPPKRPVSTLLVIYAPEGFQKSVQLPGPRLTWPLAQVTGRKTSSTALVSMCGALALVMFQAISMRYEAASPFAILCYSLLFFAILCWPTPPHHTLLSVTSVNQMILCIKSCVLSLVYQVPFPPLCSCVLWDKQGKRGYLTSMCRGYL